MSTKRIVTSKNICPRCHLAKQIKFCNLRETSIACPKLKGNQRSSKIESVWRAEQPSFQMPSWGTQYTCLSSQGWIIQNSKDSMSPIARCWTSTWSMQRANSTLKSNSFESSWLRTCLPHKPLFCTIRDAGFPSSRLVAIEPTEC